MGVQQTEGSSTAAAPSVTALMHLAIVWEALLMESEHREGRLFHIFRFVFLHIYALIHKHQLTRHVEVLYCELRRYQRSCQEVLVHSL